MRGSSLSPTCAIRLAPVLTLALALAAFASVAPPLAAEDEVPWTAAWSDDFYVDGADGIVDRMYVYDDELYVAGTFTGIGDARARGLARYDGERWRGVGGGIDGRVRVFLEYYGDLIVAGSFQQIGDQQFSNIARWDGSGWHAVGEGLPNGVHSLVVHDGLLVATCLAGSGSRAKVLEWNGAGWREIADWPDYTPPLLASYRGELYAGPETPWLSGEDDYSRSFFLLRLVNGQFQPLAEYPTELGFGDLSVRALTVIDDRLYVVGVRLGWTTDVGGQIGEWDGTSWRSLSLPNEGGCEGGPYASGLASIGGRLVVTGSFPSRDGQAGGIYVRDNDAWATLPGGALESSCYGEAALSSAIEFQGELYAAGRFSEIGGRDAASIARYRDGVWEPVAQPGLGLHGDVSDLLHDGDGWLVAGSLSHPALNESVSGIARLDGSGWHGVATGSGHSGKHLLRSQGGLAATFAGSDPLGETVRTWDGVSWRELPLTGERIRIYAITEWRGSLVIAVTRREQSGDNVARVLRWNGVEWAQMGTTFSRAAAALAVLGDDLFCAGGFVGAIARWDGENWVTVGEGLPARATHLEARGEDLFVWARGTANQPSLPGLSRWDGTSLQPISLPMTECTAMGVHAGHLILAGRIGSARDYRLLLWDGFTARLLEPSFDSQILAIASRGREIAVGGMFDSIDQGPSSLIAIATVLRGPVAPVTFSVKRIGDSAALRVVLDPASPFTRYEIWRSISGGAPTQLSDTRFEGPGEHRFVDPVGHPRMAEYWVAQLGDGDGDAVEAWFGPARVEEAPFAIVGGRAARVDGMARIEFGLTPRQQTAVVRVYRRTEGAPLTPLGVPDLTGALAYTVIDSIAPIVQTAYWLERVDISEIDGRWSGPYSIASAEVAVGNADIRRVDGDARLTWTIDPVADYARFHVWRGASFETRARASEVPIGPTIGSGNALEFVDASPPDRPAIYWLEQVMPDGRHVRWSEAIALGVAATQPRNVLARRQPGAITIEWSVETWAVGNRFHVVRGDSASGRTRIDDGPLVGRRDYQFIDLEFPEGRSAYWLEQIDEQDRVMQVDGPFVVESAADMWMARGLIVWPTPAAGDLAIGFGVPADGPVSLAVYDVTGALRVRLLERSQVRGGHSVVSWDGRDASGRRLPSGVYWALLEVGGKTRRQSIVLTR